MDLLKRPLSPLQVRAIFDVLTQEEKFALGLRRDFRGRLTIDLTRLFHSGSISLEKIWKMPVGEGQSQTWEPVATEPDEIHDLPQDFVLYLFNAAVQHPWFAEKLTEYYGSVPEVEL
ncbi:hypothetical protein [Siphonobacter curvatus]|uniref:Uncharacterized protein n=1 Tax=Siphonobacter curvatus TaxID=2094562 RepID=A0A2S7INI1_9BACT|nr:hypothetical protein [Siphonobacter curvatus]PQA59168.1 hypothetical protein C5O19_05795 [Siphonobacter curvatus]